MNKVDYDIFTLDLDDLTNALGSNVKEDIKNFDDLVNLDGALNREIYLNDIDVGAGQTIDGYIRFWNHYDDSHDIPIEERVPIRLYIDSAGGSLTDTFTIIDAIALSKTPVYTICIGTAYSGGFFCFIAGHKRFAYPSASFLYHEGSTSQGADAGKFRNYAEFYQKQLNQLKDITLKYTDISSEEYDSHIKDDWWLTSNEMIKIGACDQILEEYI